MVELVQFQCVPVSVYQYIVRVGVFFVSAEVITDEHKLPIRPGWQL